MKHRTLRQAGFWGAILLFCLGRMVFAQEPSLTVAVFDFQCKDRNLQEQGELMAELVRVNLSMDESLRLVTREEMDKLIQEMNLGISGMTDDAAPKVGHLLGAQVLVLSRLFQVKDQIYATVKVIGVETGRAFSDMAKGKAEAAEEMSQALAEKILERLTKNSKDLVAQVHLPKDQLSELKKKVANGALPRVLVYIPEEIIGEAVPDPAAQTEMEYLLLKLGCEVVKNRSKALDKWIDDYHREGGKTAPPPQEDLDLILIGEAFSEFASRQGDLITCRARLELEAFDAATGKILTANRRTQSAHDLAQQVAAKTALQEAAAQLAYEMLPEAIAAWRSQHPDAKPAQTEPAEETADAEPVAQAAEAKP
ncbi:hypothetical protein HQ520_16180 [bacterium]|nr:hypothetical protein [bacterium]